MTYYLLSDCTPNNGTVEAAGNALDIWDAIAARGGLGTDRVISVDATHAVGDRISVDWSEAEVTDLAAEC